MSELPEMNRPKRNCMGGGINLKYMLIIKEDRCLSGWDFSYFFSVVSWEHFSKNPVGADSVAYVYIHIPF